MADSRIEKRLVVQRSDEHWTAYHDGHRFVRWHDLDVARRTLTEICGNGWIVSYL